jgi:hypothetical protein
MKLTDVDSLQDQLLQVLAQLSLDQQQQVLDFVLSLCPKEPTQQWDDISNEEAATLKAEFEQEDLVMAEASMADYLMLLQQEDEA